MILLIDNYDSFAHNLARYLRRLGQEVVVERNDSIDAATVTRMRPAAIVVSPGPCTPNEAGSSLAIVRACHESIPILGVCLGHQTIAAALGGTIVRAREPMHGRTSRIEHDQAGVFAGLSSPIEVCRYHSLVVEEASLPEVLTITARSEAGEVMAIRHRALPVVGLQFHPESILSDAGYSLLANFLKEAGISVGDGKQQKAESLADAEYQPQQPHETKALPQRPVTF